jgi:8-oxo-dGTP diphosphatase
MKYIPIAGKLEPFETPIEAAKREVKEECGVDLANLKFCWVMVETSAVDFNWINFIYTAEVDFSNLHHVMKER